MAVGLAGRVGASVQMFVVMVVKLEVGHVITQRQITEGLIVKEVASNNGNASAARVRKFLRSCLLKCRTQTCNIFCIFTKQYPKQSI